jgi:hypothetical protein
MQRNPLDHNTINLLDHGYVVRIEAWGSDERIIEAARMSTSKGFQGWGPNGYQCMDKTCGAKWSLSYAPPRHALRDGGHGHRSASSDLRLP